MIIRPYCGTDLSVIDTGAEEADLSKGFGLGNPVAGVWGWKSHV